MNAWEQLTMGDAEILTETRERAGCSKPVCSGLCPCNFVLLCAFSKSNLLQFPGLLLPSLPSCHAGPHWSRTSSVGSPWLAQPSWLFLYGTGIPTHRQVLGLCTHQVVLTSLHLHGLLYAAVQSFCHCFTCWPPGKGHFVIIINSGKGLYLWTKSFTLDEIRYIPCGTQIQSWHILQHTVRFLVVKSFPEGWQRGWSFCLKVNFT